MQGFHSYTGFCLRAVIALLLGILLCGNGTAVLYAQTPDVPPDTEPAHLFLPFVLDTAPDSAFSTQEPAPGGEADDNGGKEPALPIILDNAPLNAFGTIGEVASAGEGRPETPLSLIVDTDPGVDDALALVYLFSQDARPVQVLGIVTVVGNTSVDFATNNVINILERVDVKGIQVVRGDKAPMSRRLSKYPWFVHGPDGLWGLSVANPNDLTSVRSDASAFYCDTAKATPGVTILALGPLTNLANAITRADSKCAIALKSANIVVMGGAKFGGNKTPVTEYNFWQDPKAAEIVFNAGIPITMVPLDASTQVTFTQAAIDTLIANGGPAIKFLEPAIRAYTSAQIANTGKATIPDLVAATYMITPTIGGDLPALVKIIQGDSLAGGQSIVGLSTAERVAMVVSEDELGDWAVCTFVPDACPGFDPYAALGNLLSRNPDNAQFVTKIYPCRFFEAILPNAILPDVCNE